MSQSKLTAFTCFTYGKKFEVNQSSEVAKVYQNNLLLPV